MKEYNLVELQKKVSEKLPEKRFRHTMGVAHTAANLAMRYGSDINRAFLAGLLHDIAKCYTDEKLLEKCEKFGIEITEAERNAPYLLHGKLGAYQAEHKFGIDDEEILSAIKYHTTGKPDMTLLEKIIFTADYMEPGRPMIDGLDEVRRLVYLDLDKTVCMILKHTIDYLNSNKKKKIDSMTQEAYDFYRKEELR